MIWRLVGASGSKATRTTGGIFEALALLEHRILDFLTYQLSDTVPFGDRELFGRMIEKDNSHIARVILVHDAGPDINVVFGGEARPRRNSAVCSLRNTYLNIGLHDGFAVGRNGAVVCRSQIVACRPSRA